MGESDPCHKDESESGDLLESLFGGTESRSGAEEINDGAFDEDGDSEDDEEARLIDFVVGHEADQPHCELTFPGHKEPTEGEGPIDFGDVFVCRGFILEVFCGLDGVWATEESHWVEVTGMMSGGLRQISR